MLPVTIETTGSVMLTDEVREFLNKKLEKLEKLLNKNDTTVMARVELGTSAGSRTGDLFRAEINITFKGGFVRAEAARDTLHAAIDEAVSEARREIRKSRTKHRDLVRRGAARVKDFFRNFGK